MTSIIEQIKDEVKILRGNVEKNLIDKVVDNVTPDMIKDVIDQRNDAVMVFAQIKDEIQTDSIGGGFRFSSDMEILKGKTLHIHSYIERNRTSEDAQRGGREGKVFGFRTNIVDENGQIVNCPRAIDDEFITNIQVISFALPPFSDRIDMINDLLVKVADNSEDEISGLKNTYENEQARVIELREKLTRALNSVKRYGAQLEDLIKRSKNKDFTSDLQMLSNHKLFVDMEIKDNEIVFTTDYINIYDPSNTENVFLGNKFEISVNLNNSRVRFYGLDSNRSHKSYWSSADPHPHVNGRSGEACLGNVSSTIADLCSSNEIYALFTVLVNFLQTFNIDDSAGKNIKNWEMVDGSENPYDNTVKCAVCGEAVDEDDYYRCSDCGVALCDEHATYHDHSDYYYCPTHYNERTFTCEECDDTYENMDRKEVCSVCGKVLCDECAEHHEGKTYCEECMPEQEVEVDEEEEIVEEVVEDTPVVAGARCDDCGKALQMGESISWVQDTGTLLELCADCISKREENL